MTFRLFARLASVAESSDERAERILRNLHRASRPRLHSAIVAAYEVVENPAAKSALEPSALYGPHEEAVMLAAIRKARRALDD